MARAISYESCRSLTLIEQSNNRGAPIDARMVDTSAFVQHRIRLKLEPSLIVVIGDTLKHCRNMIPSRVNLINVLVPVKRAIDYAVKIRIAKDGKGVDTTVKHSMVSACMAQDQDCSTTDGVSVS